MKNRFRLASLVATLAIVAAACSGGSGNTTAPGSSDPGTSQGPGESVAAPSAAAFPEGEFALTLWTKEGEADGSY